MRRETEYSARRGQPIGRKPMLEDLFRSRGLAWQLFVRNLRAKYRQTVLGYVWIVIPPLGVSLLWVFLQSQNVVIYRGQTPYMAYVLTGMVWWQLFSEALMAPLRVVDASRSMLTQVNFPKESLILTGLLETIFNFTVRLLILCPILLMLPGSNWPLGLPVILGGLGLLFTGFAIGLCLVPVGMLYRDVENGLTLLLQFLLYLTPVVYLRPAGWAGELQNLLNPAAGLLEMARDGLLGLDSSLSVAGMTWLGLGILGTGLAWVLFRLSMPILIERSGT